MNVIAVIGELYLSKMEVLKTNESVNYDRRGNNNNNNNIIIIIIIIIIINYDDKRIF